MHSCQCFVLCRSARCSWCKVACDIFFYAFISYACGFDRIAHDGLTYKLHPCGICGCTLKWIENFLSGRSQSVVVEGRKSPTASVTSGVPQGSVIGPVLFPVYINDLLEQVQSEMRLFADDTIIYHKTNTTNNCRTLHGDLNILQKWEETWQLAFHSMNATPSASPGRWIQ